MNKIEFTLRKKCGIYSIINVINNKKYVVIRIPHTSPTSFNRFGGKNHSKYIEVLTQLFKNNLNILIFFIFIF